MARVKVAGGPNGRGYTRRGRHVRGYRQDRHPASAAEREAEQAEARYGEPAKTLVLRADRSVEVPCQIGGAANEVDYEQEALRSLERIDANGEDYDGERDEWERALQRARDAKAEQKEPTVLRLARQMRESDRALTDFDVRRDLAYYAERRGRGDSPEEQVVNARFAALAAEAKRRGLVREESWTDVQGDRERTQRGFFLNGLAIAEASGEWRPTPQAAHKWAVTNRRGGTQTFASREDAEFYAKVLNNRHSDAHARVYNAAEALAGVRNVTPFDYQGKTMYRIAYRDGRVAISPERPTEARRRSP